MNLKSKPVSIKNRKAYHDYFVEQEFEAGIELFGTEVKSIRQSAVNIKESWCDIKNGELFLLGMNISPYEKGNIFNRDPMRSRKLLMHKKEIIKLEEEVKKQGYTLIPLAIYFKGSKVKISLGLCKGKKLYDKRESIAKKDAEMKMNKFIKERSMFWLKLSSKLRAIKYTWERNGFDGDFEPWTASRDQESL